MSFLNIDRLWCIVEEKYDVRLNKHYEGVFTQGSGYLSVRGCFEEGINAAPQDEVYDRMPANVTLETPRHLKSKWGTYVPGIAGNHPFLKEEIINLPYFLEFSFWCDTERLDMELCDIDEYIRWMDMRDGTLHRSFVWNTQNGARIKLYYKRYISQNLKNLSVQSIQINILSGSGKLNIETGIDARVRTNGYNHLTRIQPLVVESDYISMNITTNGNNEVYELSKVYSDNIKYWSIENDNERVYYKTSIDFNAGEKLDFSKLTVVSTDRDLDKIETSENRALRIIKLAEGDFNNLYDKHAEVWKIKWNISDIKLSGDDEAQLAIRFSIYHLLRSNAENDPRISICAKGYSGEAYFGHAFWDTEIYLLPFFLYTNPEAAKNLLLFRYNTLEGAKKNAISYGYNGARYPWESSTSGEEQCSNWQYADNEIHVTGDIAYALWHYYKATGDYDFVKAYAVDILIETSRYWVERVDRDTDGGYDLMGVMGPDEYIAFSNNNAYTNRMVKFNLEKAAEVLKIIKNKSIEDYEDTVERLNIDETELMLFKEISSKLIIPIDKGKDLVLQCQDFYKFADIDFDKVWTDRKQPFGHFVSQEKMYRSKCLKQADVLGMMMLFPNEYSKKQMNNAFDYYEPITTHDSSLSSVVHSIMANWIEKYDKAQEFFKRAINIDLNLKKGDAAEGIHIANCGGLWQTIIFGFAGLSSALNSDEIKLDPHLPKGWNSLEFKIMWEGKRYKIHIADKKYSIIACL